MVNTRSAFRIGIALVLLLMLALGAASYWLMATPTGSAWLIRRLTPDTVSIRAIEGCLSAGMTLQGIELHGDHGRASIGKIAWRAHLTALPGVRIKIRTLTAEDVSLTSAAAAQASPAPPTLDWPRAPGWLRWLRINAESLTIRRLRWQRPDGQMLYLEGLTARARWSGRHLQIPCLSVLSDQGAWTARAELDAQRRRLRLHAAALLPAATGNPVPLVLTLRGQAATGGAIRGTLRAGSRHPSIGVLHLLAPFHLSAGNLHLHNWRLHPQSGPGMLQGDAEFAWDGATPRIALNAALQQWNLEPLLGQPTDLGGSLSLDGTPQSFAGHLTLTHQAPDWRKLQAETDFDGNRQELRLSQLQVTGLGGSLDGRLTLQWEPHLQLRGSLAAHDLNPQAAGLAWPGAINLQADGSWSRSDTGATSAQLRAALQPSTLRGQPLKGRLTARLQERELTVDTLELTGRGIRLSASGTLAKRLDYAVELDDLGGLLPATGGSVQSRGWLRWRNEQLAGRITGTAGNLRRDGLRLRRLRFDAALADNRSLNLNARLTGIARQDWQIPDLAVQAAGTLSQHTLAAEANLPRQARLTFKASGGYAASRWQGRLTALTLADATGSLRLTRPVSLTLSPRQLQLDPLQLTGKAGEQLSATAQLAFAPLRGETEVRWQALRLDRLQPWLGEATLTGTSAGHAAWRQSAADRFAISAAVNGTGHFTGNGLQLHIASTEAQLTWDPKGLRAELSGVLKDGGKLEGRVEGGPAPRPTLPERGTWQMRLSALKLQHLAPWLPPDIGARGILAAEGRGVFLPGGALQGSGRLAVREGQIRSGREQGQMTLPVQHGELSWDWRAQRLEGRAELQLGDKSRLAGDFRLPVPARLPVRPDPDGALQASVSGRSTELGLLAALMPGAVQESRGTLELDLRAAGRWRQPQLSGRVRLLEAGAYLPLAGIELREVGLSAHLEGDRILLDDLSLRSGDGTLQGRGSLQLQNGQPAKYRLNLQGQGIQVVNLPELQVTASPDLTVSGTPAGIKVSGKVLLPEVLVRDIERPAVVAPSEDVIIVGRKEPPKTGPDFNLEANVALQLGEHVLVQTAGLDARLSGALRLTAIGTENLNAEGSIRVAEGQYAAYGTRLDITRGNLLFNGPLDQPTLDILALRSVGDVKAGVQVTGTPRTPLVRLTSEPAMSDSDRLAYIVLGRASARNAGEADLLMAAGGALLSQGESVVLRDRLKRQLGIDVLGFEAGSGDDFTGSMLTIGKYLSPSLYVSIGQSLFANTQELRLRYSLSRHWELESTTGEESGVDLYYKIEFR